MDNYSNPNILSISAKCRNTCEVSFKYEDDSEKTIVMDEGKKYTITFINNNNEIEKVTGTLLSILYNEQPVYRSDVTTYDKPSMHSGPIHRKVFVPQPPVPGLGSLPYDHRHCWIGFPQPYCDPNHQYKPVTINTGDPAWTSKQAISEIPKQLNVDPMHVQQTYPMTTSGSAIGFTLDCSDNYSSMSISIMLTVVRDIELYDFEEKETGSFTAFYDKQTGYAFIKPNFIMLPNVLASKWNMKYNGEYVIEDMELAVKASFRYPSFNVEDYTIVIKDEEGNITFEHSLYPTKSTLTDQNTIVMSGILYSSDQNKTN